MFSLYALRYPHKDKKTDQKLLLTSSKLHSIGIMIWTFGWLTQVQALSKPAALENGTSIQPNLSTFIAPLHKLVEISIQNITCQKLERLKSD